MVPTKLAASSRFIDQEYFQMSMDDWLAVLVLQMVKEKVRVVDVVENSRRGSSCVQVTVRLGVSSRIPF